MNKLRQNTEKVHQQLEADVKSGDPKAMRMLGAELNAARKSLGMPPLPVFDFWIGSDFKNSTNGVLILGESTYGVTPPLFEYVPSWCQGLLPYSDRTFSRIFNAFSGANTSSASISQRESFWATIAFTNFVQQPVGPTNQHKATDNDFRIAKKYLPDYLDLISPRGVLILGIGQAVFSAPVINNKGIPHIICPHPTGRGIKTATLNAAWTALQSIL